MYFSYGIFVDNRVPNFSGIWFCPHEDLDLEEMDDKDKLEWVYESDDMEDEWPF